MEAEQKLQQLLSQIEPLDKAAMARMQQRLDSMAKPLNSLGKLEQLLVRTAGICRWEKPDFAKRCVVVMCADNGIIEEGVTQTGSQVTTIMTDSIAEGKATVAVMARQMNCDVFAVDIGVREAPASPKVLDRNIRRGTGSFLKGPAMTRGQAVQGLLTGMELIRQRREEGYHLVATGEMGIGNTTTSSALASVLLGRDPAEMTGRGAGLSKEGIARKIEVIRQGIALHRPSVQDAVGLLSCLGGLDIPGMAGLFLGGAVYRVPVIADGFISSVAALTACAVAPAAREYIIGSHISGEPAGRAVMEALGVPYFLDCNMCLGEGTGAVASLGLYDLIERIFNTMSSFDDLDIEAYQPL